MCQIVSTCGFFIISNTTVASSCITTRVWVVKKAEKYYKEYKENIILDDELAFSFLHYECPDVCWHGPGYSLGGKIISILTKPVWWHASTFFNSRLSYYPNPLAGLLRTATIITNSTQQIVIIQELCPTFTPFDTLT